MDCLFELFRFDVIAIGENHRLVFLVVSAVAVEVADFQVIAHVGSIGSTSEFCCDSSHNKASIAISSSISSPSQSGIGVSGPRSRPALQLFCRSVKTFPRKRFWPVSGMVWRVGSVNFGMLLAVIRTP